VTAAIGRRFAKRQQLPQTRAEALDGTLRPIFENRYPGLGDDIRRGPVKPPQHKTGSPAFYRNDAAVQNIHQRSLDAAIFL
jgi:hypothetical protein